MLGDGATLVDAWLFLFVPTVVSEPATDLASSSSTGCTGTTMPMLAASDGWCDLLVGIDEDAAAAARITLPLTSEDAVLAAVDRGIVFMVATRGMRLESEADFVGETVREPMLGLDEGIPLAAVILVGREGVCADTFLEVARTPLSALVVLRVSCGVEPAASGLCTELVLAEAFDCPRLRTGVKADCEALWAEPVSGARAVIGLAAAASALLATACRRDPERLSKPPAMPKKDLRERRSLSCVFESVIEELSLDLGVR